MDATAVEIRTTNGETVLVSPCDLPLVAKFRWRAVSPKPGYRYARSVGDGEVYMHRVILGHPDGKHCDHRNGNGLDNRRENLRPASFGQNTQNQAIRATNTSGYRGVYPSRGGRRWVAQIRVNYRARYLGRFDTAEAAARAYDAAARVDFGEFARLNFPIESPAGQAAD